MQSVGGLLGFRRRLARLATLASTQYDSRRILFGKLSRYAVVGGSVAFIFNGTELYFVKIRGFDPLLSSIAAFAICVPINYVWHRHYTFKSRAAISSELRRFLIVTWLSFVVAGLTMVIVVNLLGRPALIGTLSVTLTIPSVNFFLFDRRVFNR